MNAVNRAATAANTGPVDIDEALVVDDRSNTIAIETAAGIQPVAVMLPVDGVPVNVLAHVFKAGPALQRTARAGLKLARDAAGLTDLELRQRLAALEQEFSDAVMRAAAHRG